MPRISSSSWTVPSSPSRPCSATKADVGRERAQACDRSWSTSMPMTSWPSRSSASSTRAPERSDTLALERAPALEDGDAAHRASRPAPLARRGSCSTSASSCRGRRRLARLGASAGAGRSACRRARPARAMTSPMRRTPSRMSSSRDAGEVQPHRRAAAAVDVGGAARDEGDVALLSARASRSVVSM